MNNRLPLLLAPAGSKEALYAACAAGADAVYLGGRQFGARQFAANFSNEELEHAVRYAHLRGIQVFVTVNTLITEKEIPTVLNYLIYLYQTGVDAVLIQDIGLLTLVHEVIPELTLHASTQMGIHNIPGALFAAKHGCSRIVLARELSGDEIRIIAEALTDLTVDLEVFAHGALCYAYSGRCLLSSLVGGRSGNRGMCAQPCRKKYQFESGVLDRWGRLINQKIDKNQNFLLSTKDLCLYPVLPDIVKLPVAALKIEGRMRSPDYVATVTSIYRKALESIENGRFTPDPEDLADLAIAFSRGFTTGYVSGASFSEVMGREYPGNQGFIIGTVISGRNGFIKVRLSSSIIPKQGDGLVIRDKNREEGLVLRKNPVVNGDVIELPSPFNPKTGAIVCLTKRKSMENKISTLLTNSDQRYVGFHKISCSLDFSSDGTILISGEVSDPNNNTHLFNFKSCETLELAKTRSLTIEQVKEQLIKTGGTIFSFSDITVSGEERWFAPVRVLNNLRREILKAAEEVIIRKNIPESRSISLVREKCRAFISSHTYEIHQPVQKPQLVTVVSSFHEAKAALENTSDMVFLLWNSHDFNGSIFQDYKNRIGIMVPGVIRQDEFEIFLKDIKKIAINGYPHILTDSPGIGEYLIEIYPGISVAGYYGLPVSNSRTVAAFQGYIFCTLSPELSRHEIKSLCLGIDKNHGPELAVCCQGLLETAITEDNLCSLFPEKGKSIAIRDEKNYSFPVYYEKSGRSHILNSLEHSYVDECFALRDFGIRWFIIDARYRGPDYAGEMTRLWKTLILNEIPDEEKKGIREDIIALTYHGITRSGYKRGLCGERT